METVTLKPGQTLKITSVQTVDTPFGTQRVETSCEVHYDTLMAIIGQKNHKTESKKRPYGTISRKLNLAAKCIKSGKWTNGSKVDVKGAVMKALSEYEMYKNNSKSDVLTTKGHKSLEILENYISKQGRVK